MNDIKSWAFVKQTIQVSRNIYKRGHPFEHAHPAAVVQFDPPNRDEIQRISLNSQNIIIFGRPGRFPSANKTP